VSFGPGDLLEKLGRLEQRAGTPDRWVIGLSGGLDSTVLADMLCKTRPRHGKVLLAVHVDHQLQPEATAFSARCRDYAASRSLPFESITVDVDRESGHGPEAAAREARYAALASIIGAGDWLLSAHHRDDQAETLLLNLLRGSGPLGLAGMEDIRRFAGGWLARPLLGVPRIALERYAEEHELDWIDDPSNDDSRYDRNFLRNEILPRVRERWPDAAERLSRSAALARDAAGLLDELADIDLAAIADAEWRISVTGLDRLSASRRCNVIRRAARRSGLPVPGSVHLEQIDRTLIAARSDAAPLVSWPGGEARRFRDRVYLMPTMQEASLPEIHWPGSEALDLGHGLGRLRLEASPEGGLDPAIARNGFTLRQRRGGEEIKTNSQSPTRKLKKLLNEHAIVPWMRDRLPLIYSGDRLVAVADLWIAAGALTRPGMAIRWDDRPRLT